MEKKHLGEWFIIIGIIMLSSGIFLYILRDIFHLSRGWWLLCSMEVILFLIILGLIYILTGSLTWYKKSKIS